MSNYVQMREVPWLGATYQVEVKRMSDATLDVVALEDGSKYFDNKISVRILRKDGSEFFKRVFTKADFLSYIDSGTKKHGALLGIVYVKAEGDWLFFAASVGSPDVTSDEYIPMVLKISRMGAVSISRIRSWTVHRLQRLPDRRRVEVSLWMTKTGRMEFSGWASPGCRANRQACFCIYRWRSRLSTCNTGKLSSGHVRVWSILLSKGLFEKCNRRDGGVE